MLICELDRLPGKPVTWAIVVLASPVALVTAFLSQSPRHIERKKRECG